MNLDKINIIIYDSHEVIIMKKTEILSLPKILFAHSFSANEYSNNNFPQRSDVIEVTYIQEGYLSIVKDNEIFRAQTGDILCLLHDSPMAVTCKDFHCHHTVRAAVLWETTNASNALHLPLITKACQETEEISEIIDKFVYSSYLYDNSYAKAATEFMNILCKINSIYIKNNESASSQTNILSIRAKKYIEKNIYKPITQAEVARYLGVTPQYLCNIFKKSEGISIIKYINSTKLKKLHYMIENENIMLYEAAQLFGYSDANYVSYLYKKMFGRNITSKANSIQIDVTLK